MTFALEAKYIKNDGATVEKDIFKDTYVRYLGYANEVGEAFRSLVHVNWVRLSYGVATAYVVSHAVDKGWKSSTQPVTEGGQSREVAVAVAAGDTLLWQGFASVILPGFTINRICTFTGMALKNLTRLSPPVRRWTTTAVGLACIPLIIKPIDNAVDYALDKTVRPLYRQPQAGQPKAK